MGMRIRVLLKGKEGVVEYPVGYNRILLSFIYSSLGERGNWLHNEGWVDRETGRRFKFFTFSRFLPKEDFYVRDGKIIIGGSFYWVFSTCDLQTGTSILKTLMEGKVKIGHNDIIVEDIQIETELPDARKKKFVFKTISPVVVCYAFKDTDEKKWKSQFIDPMSKDWSLAVIRNLQAKAQVWFNNNYKNKKLEKRQGYIGVSRLVKDNPVWVKFNKNGRRFYLKGWEMEVFMFLSEDLMYIAYFSGIGMKNSMGFGCLSL